MGTIRDQRLPFIFELYRQGEKSPSKSFILPINPESYKTIYPSRSSVVHTKGGAFVDNFGAGLPRISMSGTFTYKGSLPQGPANHFEGAQKDGWALYKEFEDDVLFAFWREFGADANPKIGEETTLKFLNFTDEQAYEVSIPQVTISRSIQRKFLYQYQIEMQAISNMLVPESSYVRFNYGSGDLEYKLPQKVDPSLALQVIDMLKKLTHLSTQISDAINALDDAMTTINMVAVAVNGFIDGATSLIKAPFDLVIEALSAVDAVTAKIVTVADLPHEIIDKMRTIKRQLLSSKINQILFAGTDLRADATGVDSEISELAIFGAGITINATIGSTLAVITTTDTIEGIAARMTGSASNWRQIAAMNNLEAPFIVGDPAGAVSAEIAYGTLVSVVGRTITTDGIVIADGNVLLIRQGVYWDIASVDSVAGNEVTVSEPLQNEYNAGATITVHDRALAVLLPGDKIKTPSTGGPQATTGNSTDHLDVIYGSDEYIDRDGNPPEDSSGDVATVVGMRNLEMQLTHRFRTVRGSLAHLGHPDYGSLIPTMVGRSNSDYWIERIKVEAKMTILQDDRLVSIDTMEMKIEADMVYIEATVTTITEGDQQKISLVV